MKPNLHLLACQMHWQARAVGQTAGHLELWMERLIQLYKQEVSRRKVTHDPEKVVAGVLELQNCLRAMAPDGGRTVARLLNMTDDEDAPAGEEDEGGAGEAGSHVSTRDQAQAGHLSLLGAGEKVKARTVVGGQTVEQLLAGLSLAVGAEYKGWRAADFAVDGVGVGATMHIHSSMRLPHRKGDITSAVYKRSRTRDSSHIIIQIRDAAGVDRAAVVQVQAYVRVCLPGDPNKHTLRVAVVRRFVDVVCHTDPAYGDVFAGPVNRYETNVLLCEHLEAAAAKVCHTTTAPDSDIHLFKGFSMLSRPS